VALNQFRELNMQTNKHQPVKTTSYPLIKASALAFSVIAIAIALSGCGQKSEPKANEKTNEKVNEKTAPPAGIGASGASVNKQTKAALAVTVAMSTTANVPISLAANGTVAAWQEASVAAEAANLRISDVLANVGDTVRKGQVLIKLSDASVQADAAAQRATVADAQAQLAEARSNAERARQLDQTGAISAIQIQQYLTAEKTAKARLEAAQARLQSDQIRLTHSKILAPDDGIISLKTAVVGAVVQPGQEMFRLIRKGRLEWRAEVPSSELGKIKPQQTVTIDAGENLKANGTVRMIAPTVDAQTRNALIYVDLPAGTAIKSGMYAKGSFDLGSSSGVTVPAASVIRRDGFQYVFTVDSDSKVKSNKIEVGARVGDRVEVRGIAVSTKVVNTGAGFLNDGDVVRVEVTK
jgi:HlyD family secretion protein